jgi:pimeloyl-ACP methyl ester carboxylesterase
MFQDMFTARIDPVVARRIIDRVFALPRPIGETVLLDLQRYDVTRWSASLGCLRVPVLALQTTYANEKRERKSLQPGQSSPYLDMLRQAVPAAVIEIIADTGHFPQFEEPARTNAALEAFVNRV